MLDTFRKATPEALAAIREEMEIRKTNELFLLFSLGSQTDHLIYLSLAKLGVYCLVADPATATFEDVYALVPAGLAGIILSGGPSSVASEPPPFDTRIFDLGIPVLGICLGFQMWAKHKGIEVAPGATREFGVHTIQILDVAGIFASFSDERITPVVQSHGDEVQLDARLSVTAVTVADGTRAVVAAASFGHLHGVQFHPEKDGTARGIEVFINFCFGVCEAKCRFPAGPIGARKVAELRSQIGDDIVLLALSGGSDSATVAYLLKQATRGRQQLYGVYIRGVDRPDDEAFVRKFFGNEDWITLSVVDATDRFLEALAGKTSMRDKRLAVRAVYKPILEEHAACVGARFIAQGTLYTDLAESGTGHATGARRATIKLHHNTNLGFSLPELAPLSDCVKDGGRDIGRELGTPEELLVRHPFPGPGLVVRIEGEITREKLAMARQLDGIYIEELRRAGLYDSVWQAGIVVTQSSHTLTQGDDAGEGPVIAYWAVWSVNGFTARAAHLPDEFHERLARRVGNEVRGAGPVAYRYTGKPYATIEWG